MYVVLGSVAVKVSVFGFFSPQHVVALFHSVLPYDSFVVPFYLYSAEAQAMSQIWHVENSRRFASLNLYSTIKRCSIHLCDQRDEDVI